LVTASHAVGALFVLDACQSAPHFKIDVQKLDIDFLAFSGHKALGPTGVGILWGRLDLLNQMEPFLTGGSMIETVTMTEATWAKSPKRFEAGVPNMAQAVGFAAAIKYLEDLGMDNVAKHEQELTSYALDKFKDLSGVNVIGPKNNIDRGSVISFTMDGIHPHDVGQVLDQYGIAVRTGHHCAWPLMRKLGLVGTTRASFYIYNDESDVDSLISAIGEAKKYFKV
jgi:cysteine desulfurase/selenocysteine lyase